MNLRTVAVVMLMFLAVGLRVYVTRARRAGSHSIAFYPGAHADLVMHSDKAVSAAMEALHAAGDTPARAAALTAVQNMADAGDADAAFRLGRYYHLECAEPDYALARKYYELAVAGKHAWATNNLGLLYQGGFGVDYDDRRAYEYFLSAANQGNAWGYYNTSQMTFLGRGVKRDRNEGIAWLEKGALDHCALCLVEKAAIYHSGAYGIQADQTKVLPLLTQAAIMGDSHATLVIAKMKLVGDSMAQSSTEAFDLLKKASDGGYGDATNYLGEMAADQKIRERALRDDFGAQAMPADFNKVFPEDLAGAKRDWELASKQGNCQALINLSSVYDRGVGVSVDAQKALDYVAQATRCDPTNAYYLWKLGIRYQDGMGTPRDCEATQKYLRQSLAHGYADAAVGLGYLYDKGCAPIAHDDRRAFQIYLQCAKQGVALCQNNVGAMLKHGRGVPAANLSRAFAWMKLAALNGDELARKNLNAPEYTTEVRVKGLAELADIKTRLLVIRRASQEGTVPWY